MMKNKDLFSRSGVNQAEKSVTLPNGGDEGKSIGYQCPMKCEGDNKVYDHPGTCPVCKMKLVPVE